MDSRDDKPQTETARRRDRILIRASRISALGNALLSVAKLIAGVVSGSLAVIGDGIDSAADVVISLVMIFAARIVSRPPTPKYIFGYDKAEDIATKVLSLVIFYAGAQMIIGSVMRIFAESPREMPTPLAIYVTLFSIAGKLLLSAYQHRQGKRIDSSLLLANAANMRADVVISLGVLAGLGFTFILKLPLLDTITGLLVGVFILRSSVRIFLDSNVGLMDGVRDTSVYDRIFEAVSRVEGAGHPHRVRSRMVGSLYMVVLDIEVDPEITVSQGHEIAEAVERSIRQSVPDIYDIVVHVEPSDKPQSDEPLGLDETSPR